MENNSLLENGEGILPKEPAHQDNSPEETQKYFVFAGKYYLTSEREGKVHIYNK